MRIGAHTALAGRREGQQVRLEGAILVKQLFGPVTLHPVFENLDVGSVLVHLAHRYLMRSPIVFCLFAVDLFWTRPAFWCTHDDHWPKRTPYPHTSWHRNEHA